jgi:hypothetical protein
MTDNVSKFVTLYTIHCPNCELSDPQFNYDPSRGHYFRNCHRYRESLSILKGLFGVEQILWCWHNPVGWWMSEGEVLWEIDLPISSIIALFDSHRWDDFVRRGGKFDLRQFQNEEENPSKVRWEVLVRWPLDPQSRVKKLGSLGPTGYQLGEALLKQLRSGSR